MPEQERHESKEFQPLIPKLRVRHLDSLVSCSCLHYTAYVLSRPFPRLEMDGREQEKMNGKEE